MTTFVGMTQATVKCLDLWNGTSNNAAPTGWEAPAFDDSAWAFSANPTLVLDTTDTPNTYAWAVDLGEDVSPGYVNAPQPYVAYPLPSGVEPCWPQASMRDPGQQACFRWSFTFDMAVLAGPANANSTIVLGSPGTAGRVRYGPSKFDIDEFSGREPNMSVNLNGAGWRNFFSTGTDCYNWLNAHAVNGANLLAVASWDHGAYGDAPPVTNWQIAAWLAIAFVIYPNGSGRSFGTIIGD